MRYRKSGTATGALSVQDPRIEKFAFFFNLSIFLKKNSSMNMKHLLLRVCVKLDGFNYYFPSKLPICDIKCLPHKQGFCSNWWPGVGREFGEELHLEKDELRVTLVTKVGEVGDGM